MKRIFLPLAVLITLTTSSCTKETLSRLDGIVNNDASDDKGGNRNDDDSDDDSNDDNGGDRNDDDSDDGDDHGGDAGSGGGEHVSSSSIPEAVMNAFNSKYPSASVIEWKKLDNGNYKVEFTLNGVEWEATFSASGDLLKEEQD